MADSMLRVGGEQVELDDQTRAEVLAIAENLAGRDGPLLDDRDAEAVEEIERMAQLVDVI